MLTTYVQRQTTQTTYYSGPAGPHLDAFTHWLEQCGYRHGTIRHRLQGAAQFATWAQTTGCPLPSLSPVTLEHFRHHLAKHGQLLHSGGALSGRWLGAQLFFAFLQAQQIIGLCRKFCLGGREGVVAPVYEGIKQPGSRTVRPQCGPRLPPRPPAAVS